MTVKELKFILEDKKDNVNVIFMSTSGIEWEINPKVLYNPKIKEEKNQLVIYIK